MTWAVSKTKGEREGAPTAIRIKLLFCGKKLRRGGG